GMHGNPRRAHHWPISVSAPRRIARAARRAACRASARASHGGLVAAPGRLPHHADRKVAPRLAAGLWAAQERLRRILGPLWRRRRLLPPRLRGPFGSVGWRNTDRGGGLHDRPARRANARD